MKLEKMPPRTLKGITKGLEVYGFGIYKYSLRSKSGRMIALRAHMVGISFRSCQFRKSHPYTLVKFHCQGSDAAVRCLGVSCVVVRVATY